MVEASVALQAAIDWKQNESMVSITPVSNVSDND